MYLSFEFTCFYLWGQCYYITELGLWSQVSCLIKEHYLLLIQPRNRCVKVWIFDFASSIHLVNLVILIRTELDPRHSFNVHTVVRGRGAVEMITERCSWRCVAPCVTDDVTDYLCQVLPLIFITTWGGCLACLTTASFIRESVYWTAPQQTTFISFYCVLLRKLRHLIYCSRYFCKALWTNSLCVLMVAAEQVCGAGHGDLPLHDSWPLDVKVLCAYKCNPPNHVLLTTHLTLHESFTRYSRSPLFQFDLFTTRVFVPAICCNDTGSS